MWWKLSPHTLRRCIQFAFTGLCVFIGWRFYLYCLWAVGASEAAVSRPAGVEGFLPISALLGLKNFALTGQYDPVHPAGLTILLFALATAFTLRKGFCGFICPVGLVSDLLAALGRRLGIQRSVTGWPDFGLRLLKYPLLGFFAFTILVQMPVEAVRSFMTSPYNLTADARMLLFFLSPSATALWVLVGLAGLSLVVKNAWCRWLCPYGALLGLPAWAGATAVCRDEAACTGCKRCQKTCPAAIPIHTKVTVRTPECIGCARCTQACNAQGALRVTAFGRPVHWATLGLGTAGLFVAAWGVAKATGHWDSTLPPQMLKALYARALEGTLGGL